MNNDIAGKHYSYDKLDSIFSMQVALQHQMFDKLQLGPVDSVPDFHYSMTALVTEIGEVMTADKRWKNARAGYYNKEEKLEEFADCMAFLVNAIMYSGFNADEFYEAFSKKWLINMKRS